MPDWIHGLLTSEGFNVFARIVLTSFFWTAGIMTLLKPAAIVASVGISAESRISSAPPRHVAPEEVHCRMVGGVRWPGVFSS